MYVLLCHLLCRDRVSYSLTHLPPCTAITSVKRRLILEAMERWSSETCLRFLPVPKSNSSAKGSSGSEFGYWLNFRADSTGCYSFVGRDENCFRQGQPVSISHGCDSVGDQLFHSPCHTLAHTLCLASAARS